MPQKQLHCYVLAGATATAKTAVGEWLAERLGLTIVCADSRQVFRELSVGTGKPTAAERSARPHRLFDSLSVGEPPSAGWYALAAAEAAHAIDAAGGMALFVGGSGLYLKALIDGLSAQPPRDGELRQQLRAAAERLGGAALHERLARVDPERALQLDVSDVQRVTRALEIVESSGHTTAWWQSQPTSRTLDAEWHVVELTRPAAALQQHIEARTREMFDSGLVEETRGLIEAGRESALSSLRAVGYDEAIELLHGRLGRAEAEARTSLRTRQLAKRQRTWFRNQLDATRIPVAGHDIAAPAGETLAAFGLDPRSGPQRAG